MLPYPKRLGEEFSLSHLCELEFPSGSIKYLSISLVLQIVYCSASCLISSLKSIFKSEFGLVACTSSEVFFHHVTLLFPAISSLSEVSAVYKSENPPFETPGSL